MMGNISYYNLFCFRLKKNRDSTNQAKQSMDSFNLQLQNLLYEVLHLKKEVTKCINFKVIFNQSNTWEE